MSDALERSRGDRYALSALRNKRASLAAEIVSHERQLRHCRESLVHVDATLRLLDPSADPDSIPNKRLPKRIKLFRQGELGRLILDVLRQASEPVSTRDVVTAMLRAGGHGESARRTVAPRVRGNLAYLHSRRKVTKHDDAGAVRWSIN
jgi:hypothetical protein